MRWITGGAGYLSSHDQLRLDIRWPDGSGQIVTGLKLNQYNEIVE